MSERTRLVRHFVAALAYRFRKSIDGSPSDFDELDLDHGIRTPLAIVHHINGVLGYGEALLLGAGMDYRHRHPRLDWAGEVAAVHTTLGRIDRVLAELPDPAAELLERILQGPLSDAMTHVGQLAMLRRVAGSPVRAENFVAADIRIGQVGEDQPPPASPDPE